MRAHLHNRLRSDRRGGTWSESPASPGGFESGTNPSRWPLASSESRRSSSYSVPPYSATGVLLACVPAEHAIGKATVLYVPRRATMGSSREARCAGWKPKKTPTAQETPIPERRESGEMKNSQPVIRQIP